VAATVMPKLASAESVSIRATDVELSRPEVGSSASIPPDSRQTHKCCLEIDRIGFILVVLNHSSGMSGRPTEEEDPWTLYQFHAHIHSLALPTCHSHTDEPYSVKGL
jgi:hypothetical protein